MKNFKFAVIAAAFILSSFTLQAQQQQQRPQRSREDFQKFQIQMMTKELLIEESKRENFAKIYTEYTQELEKLREPRKEGEKGGKGQNVEKREKAAPTDAEIEAQILKSFEMAEKSTELKKRYYTKFKAVLTPQQIMKMYQIERLARERVTSRQGGKGQGGRPQGGQGGRPQQPQQ